MVPWYYKKKHVLFVFIDSDLDLYFCTVVCRICIWSYVEYADVAVAFVQLLLMGVMAVMVSEEGLPSSIVRFSSMARVRVLVLVIEFLI